MTVYNALSLFIIMFFLSLIPSTSSILVATRAVTYGFLNGVCTAAGIVVGDLILVLIVMLGLIGLTENWDESLIIRYCAAAYLIWVGINLVKSTSTTIDIEKPSHLKLSGQNISSFFSGLCITMGDLKAIFFYLSFLPAFVELSSLRFKEAMTICIIVALTVGAGKVGYAYLGSKIKFMSKRFKIQKYLTIISGTLIIGVGLILIKGK